MRRLILAAVLSLAFSPVFAGLPEGTTPVFLEPIVSGRHLQVATFWQRDGAWVAEGATWQALGVELQGGEAGRDLSAAELGVLLDVHMDDMTVDVVVPADRLPVQPTRAKDSAQAPVAPMAPGVLVNYSLAGSVGAHTQAASLGHDVRIGGAWGAFSTTGQANVTNGVAHYVRGLTRWQKDDLAHQVAFEAGDVVAGAQPVNLGGVRIAKDPAALDPSTPTYPLPVLGGVALDPGEVRVLANESEVLRQDVGRGPFTIDRYGLAPGRNATSVVVRDQFGRDTVLSQQQLYFTQDVLRKGLTTWEVAAGAVREDESTYGTLGASARFAWGASDRWTLRASAQADEAHHHHATMGATTVLPGVGGVLDVEAGQSNGPQGAGTRLAASYELRGPNASVRVEHERNANWWQLQSARAVEVQARTRVAVAWRPNADLQLRAGYTNLTTDRDHLRYVDVGAAWTHGAHGLVASAAWDFQRGEQRVEVGYRYRFNASASGYVRARQAPNLDALAVGGTLRTDWRGAPVHLAAQVEQSAQGVHGQARADASTTRGYASAQVVVDHGNAVASGQFTGAVHIGADGFTWLDQATGSYGVIDVPGQAGVPVRVGGRVVGKTNAAGRLVVGSVGALAPTDVEIDARALPMDVQVNDTKTTVRAQRVGGMHVVFPVASEQARVFTVEGHGLVPGMTVRSAQEAATLGYDGLLFLAHPEAGQTLEVEGVCRLTLPTTLPAYGDATKVACVPLQ